MPRGKTGEQLKHIWAKKRERGHGVFTVTVRGVLAEKIRDAAVASGCHSVEAWAREALEYMVHEHRSGKYRADPFRHTASNQDDESDLMAVYF